MNKCNQQSEMDCISRPFQLLISHNPMILIHLANVSLSVLEDINKTLFHTQQILHHMTSSLVSVLFVPSLLHLTIFFFRTFLLFSSNIYNIANAIMQETSIGIYCTVMNKNGRTHTRHPNYLLTMTSTATFEGPQYSTQRKGGPFSPLEDSFSLL